MFIGPDSLVLSPTDLSSFLTCRHRIGLDLAMAHGALSPPEWRDPLGQALRDRGRAHEQEYLSWLRGQGLDVLDLSVTQGPDARDAGACDARAGDLEARTRAALHRGVDVIYQALLSGNGWRGYADILRRVEQPSGLGGWRYEVHDTKLARETRGGTVLQLVAYSEMLAGIQGVWPEHFTVVTPAIDGAATGQPFHPHRYRVADYAAYYRGVRRALLATLAHGHEAIQQTHYPEPVETCELCRWWERCNGRRRGDDHLAFIAGIARTHRTELITQGVPTLAAAAQMPVPVPFNPTRGSREAYARLGHQARVQRQQRTTQAPVHELLPLLPGLGLARLPEPSPGDLFLDLEGARFARDGGREYLFGVWQDGAYHGWWAHDDAEERAAFEAVVDRVAHTVQAHPGAYVYHFGHYEASTFKRLMGRYATRADALDRLLRAERFVDLHVVVRQALRAGVESYSIKELEQFYGFIRAVPLKYAGIHMQAIELALEGGAPGAIPDASRTAVQGYNEDDCRSTQALRDWLEALRAACVGRGLEVRRPEPKEAEAPDKVSELETRQAAARATLLAGLPLEAIEPAHPDHPKWLLAYLLDWHRREDKAQYWERYRLNDLSDEALVDERQAIAGLEFVERLGPVLHKTTRKPTGSVIDRYRYPAQDVEIGRKGDLLVSGPTTFGSIEAHDRSARVIDVKKRKAMTALHPAAVFQADVMPSDAMQHSLLRLCDAVGVPGCGTDLLFRRPPRLLAGTLDPLVFETPMDHAVRLGVDLDRTTLAVQGPPGSGKTYVGAQMIRALVKAGKKVGVVAVSHKVIRNLLDAVRTQAAGAGETVRMGHKVGDADDAPPTAAVVEFGDNASARSALADRTIDVLGGTAWLWAREEFARSVDVLFVDEAGQMSLANALAVSPAGGSLVLLGDPQQLEQPQKGSHPDGVDVSALQHVLGVGEHTMPHGRGLFLAETWRLAPQVCAFTSELFYENKLHSREGLDRQVLVGTGQFDGAGLWWLPVEHEGNCNWSPEEIDAVTSLADRLLAPGSQWVDQDGMAHQLDGRDLLVVAPYNAHVNRLSDRLSPRGIRVGTVDKFQGQEAPVVIYAMAASSPDDAPRGLGFLYSLNRLNVATSRARCAAFVVASPRLLSPECRTPHHMKLANALCRFVELATPA